MLDIYVDGDACPVKNEVYRVALRHDLKVYVVSAGPIRMPAAVRAEAIRVRRDFGAADDWIAEHVGPGDIVVTADIPLADRCIKRGAHAIGSTGRSFDAESIGDALASRELMEYLRQMGETTRGPAPFTPADRSRFLGRLEEVVIAVRRAAQRSAGGPGGGSRTAQ